METERGSARQVALLGMLFSLAMALSVLESTLPPLLPVPGVKVGLANVVTMYCVFVLGSPKAGVLAVLKAAMVLLTRGLVASALSLCGGLLSVLVMAGVDRFFGGKASVGIISMAGAVAHNLGQLLLASLLLGLDDVFWYYLPLLIASGLMMGLLTSVLLRGLLPLLKRMDKV